MKSALVAWGLVLAATGAMSQVPVGDPFPIAESTTGQQRHAGAVAQAGEGFVVVWESEGADGDASSVRGRRFAANGAPLSGEFAVNEVTTGDQKRARVVAQAGRGFVVVWESEGADGDGLSVRGRRFAANGAPLSDEFAINEVTTGDQRLPGVAADESGDFAVVWVGDDRARGGDGVFARLFRADGAAIAPEFQVNVQPVTSVPVSRIRRNALGRFVVVWRSSSEEIRVSVFDARGSVVVPEVVVNSSGKHPLSSWGFGPEILSDGRFFVAWSGSHEVGGWPATDIFQQRFAQDGTRLGGEFQVSDSGPYGWYPSTGFETRVTESEDFVVVWHTDLNLAWGAENRRRTLVDGSVEPIKELASGVVSGSRSSAVPNGEFVVVWDTYECCFAGARFDPAGNRVADIPVPDTEGWPVALIHPDADVKEFIEIRTVGETMEADLIGQRYSAQIFVDGFESGDTSAWSVAVP